MLPPIAPIPPSIPGSSTTKGASGAGANNFTSVLGHAVGSLQASQVAAQHAAVGVAAGTTSLSSAMVSATKAELGTQLTVAVVNAAVTSFNQVMAL